MKKYFAFALCLLMVCFGITSALAFDIVPFASTVVSSASCTLSASGNTLTAKATLKTKTTASKLGVTSLRIQEKQDGIWITVKSTTNVFEYNKMAFSTTLSHTGRSGYEYRAIAAFTATVGGVTESPSKTSSAVSP